MMFEEVIKSKEGPDLLEADILRTLYLFSGTLWLPELYDEYVGFVRTLGEVPAEKKAVEKAIERLASKGLVQVRKGVRATASPKGEETFLISFANPLKAREILSADERVMKYLSEWKKYVGELRKRKG